MHRPVARLFCEGGSNRSNFGTFYDYASIILRSRWIWPFWGGGSHDPPDPPPPPATGLMHIAVNAETFQTIEHNPVRISILLYTKNPHSYSHFEIVICIYSVRGDIDQMLTNTSSYTICSAPNVYIFVYILNETRIAPLNKSTVIT